MASLDLDERLERVAGRGITEKRLSAQEGRPRALAPDGHNGDLSHAVEAGHLGRGDVTELGAVLAGLEDGRRSDGKITAFDSTGLAVQDLAIALAALERADELDLPAIHV